MISGTKILEILKQQEKQRIYKGKVTFTTWIVEFSISLFPFCRHRKAFHVVIKDHTNRLSYLEDPTGNELYRVNVFPKTGISLNPEWRKEDKRSISDQSLRYSKL